MVLPQTWDPTSHEARMSANQVLTELMRELTNSYGEPNTLVREGVVYIRTEVVRDKIEKMRPVLGP